MIKLLVNSDIDKQKWDACIQSSGRGFYALSAYLDLVSPNWEALVQDDYEAVMPLPIVKKYGVKLLIQPFFCQQLGLFSGKPLNSELWNLFQKALPFYLFITYNLHSEMVFLKERMVTRPNFELDISKSYEELSNTYSSNTKRNIKKAIGEGVLIKETSIIDLIALYKKFIAPSTPEMREKHYRILEAIVGLKGINATVIGAFNANGNLIAGTLFYGNSNRMVFLFSASSDEAKQNGAMSLIVDSFIRENAKKVNVLDFEGSSIPGLARFYSSFGAINNPYFNISKNCLSWRYYFNSHGNNPK